MHGDFAGLDDLFTESPTVVRGFIDVYGQWIERFGIDGYRIDTVKHVNLEFWEAFAPAIRAKARERAIPDFFQFGEVADHTGDTALVSEFSTTGNLDATLDFGFYDGARDFVSKGHAASGLAKLFENDAWYTGPDCNAQGETTFVSNHDDGRFGLFPEAGQPEGRRPARCATCSSSARSSCSRSGGSPSSTMGTSRAWSARGTTWARERTCSRRRRLNSAIFRSWGRQGPGADDKFDTGHPFYRTIQTLANLRMANPALSRGRDAGSRDQRPRMCSPSRASSEASAWNTSSPSTTRGTTR